MLSIDDLKREIARLFIAYVGIDDGAPAERSTRAKPKTNTEP
jgi:hypothetical protein